MTVQQIADEIDGVTLQHIWDEPALIDLDSEGRTFIICSCGEKIGFDFFDDNAYSAYSKHIARKIAERVKELG